MRLFASPMESGDFIAGYTLPLIPMAVAQILICFVTALFLGLSASLNILLTVLVSIPAALLFIGIGLLCGSVFNDKQVGGACGALLTNLSAWLSGTWFDPAMVGGVFGKAGKEPAFSARSGCREICPCRGIRKDHAGTLVGAGLCSSGGCDRCFGVQT